MGHLCTWEKMTEALCSLACVSLRFFSYQLCTHLFTESTGNPLSKSKWSISHCLLINLVNIWVLTICHTLFSEQCTAKGESLSSWEANIWILLCLFMKIYKTSKHSAFHDGVALRSDVQHYAIPLDIWWELDLRDTNVQVSQWFVLLKCIGWVRFYLKKMWISNMKRQCRKHKNRDWEEIM